MISYARLKKTDLHLIKGVFLNVPVMVFKSRFTVTIDLNQDHFPFEYERITVFDTIVAVCTHYLPIVTDRMDDFNIKGLRWKTIDGEKYREHAYTDRVGIIHFRIATMRNARTFKPVFLTQSTT